MPFYVGRHYRLLRAAQAEFIAGLVQGRQAAAPGEPLVVLGDLDAPAFTDGYVDVAGAIAGAPAAAATVSTSTADLVDPNLEDALADVPAASRYTSTAARHRAAAPSRAGERRCGGPAVTRLHRARQRRLPGRLAERRQPGRAGCVDRRGGRVLRGRRHGAGAATDLHTAGDHRPGPRAGADVASLRASPRAGPRAGRGHQRRAGRP